MDRHYWHAQSTHSWVFRPESRYRLAINPGGPAFPAGKPEGLTDVTSFPSDCLTNRGVVTVVKCGDAFTVTHQADLDVAVAATPAMDQDTLYLRTGDALLAFR